MKLKNALNGFSNKQNCVFFQFKLLVNKVQKCVLQD